MFDSEKQPGVKLCTSCVQDIENICEFDVFPVVPNKLGKDLKYEAKIDVNFF